MLLVKQSMIDILEAIQQVCAQTIIPTVDEVFGTPGVDAAFSIMETAKALYRHVEPERIDGYVVIFRSVNQPPTATASLATGLAADFGTYTNATVGNLVLEVGPDGRPYPRTMGNKSVEDLALSSVVYRWQSGHEEFLAGTKRKHVTRLDPSAHSQFAIPTLSNLRDALRRYDLEIIRQSSCLLFREVWHDRSRLFLKAGPESQMRDSLTQFLRARMGADHNVFPEQNVDDSHPVDIRVQTRLKNNRIMLIEIKWLGCSVAEDGHITARHGGGRAQEGADQLAEYLDAQLQSAPTSVIQGYYVIIDCRRRNLTETTISTCHEDGMYYENDELRFDPAHDSSRQDFDPPFRMFARPICAE